MASPSIHDAEGSLKSMPPGHVLVMGCAAGPTSAFGVEADERAIVSQQVSATKVATATAHGQDIVPTSPSVLHDQSQQQFPMATFRRAAIPWLKSASFHIPHPRKVCSLRSNISLLTGAVLETVTIQMLSNMLSKGQWICVVDMEQWFSVPSREALTAFRTLILPHTTVLCTSVDEALALLGDAGAPVPAPRGIPDIQLISIALRHLGPEHVVIKQEFVDEVEQTTSLLYVLCRPQEEPVYERLRCANPRAVLGASYSIPSAIAARLAKGDEVSEAVPAAFEHVKGMIERGMILDDEGVKKSDICIYQETF